MALSFATIRFFAVIRQTMKAPSLMRCPQKWVKPKNVKVSGFPSPRCFRSRAQDGFAASFPVGLFHPLQHAGFRHGDGATNLFLSLTPAFVLEHAIRSVYDQAKANGPDLCAPRRVWNKSSANSRLQPRRRQDGPTELA